MANERFHHIIMKAPFPMMIYAEDGEVIFINNAWSELTGYSLTDLTTVSDWTSRVFSEQSKEVKKDLKELNLSKKLRDGGELEIKTKDGDKLIWEFYPTSPGKTEDGKKLSLFIAVDVTKRKKTEENLQREQKIEALGTLAGGIAHEFNNILQVITGNAELGRMASQDDTNGRQRYENILEISERASNLVRQLLIFSKIEITKLEPVNLFPVVKEALKIVKEIVPANIEIHEDLSVDCPDVLADSTQISQVVLNLSTNANQAMEETGGVLSVSLKNIQRNKCPNAPRKLNEYNNPLTTGCVKLVFTDTGRGIYPEEQNKIFDPFYTKRGVGEGAGMGLSVVHGIIEKHQGKITVDTEIGKGSIFSIYLPVIEKNVHKK